MTTENRKNPRVEILAQVQVASDSEVYIMSTANISLGGVFIQGDPQEYPEIKKEMTLDLVIFATDDNEAADVHVEAKVVRVAEEGAPGFGLHFAPVDEEQSRALERLIQAVDAA